MHQIFWTYHVNMRMKNRSISRDIIKFSVNNLEIIESYPEDKYFPSYLTYSRNNELIFHIVIAVDFKSENIRIVTAYYPDLSDPISNVKKIINEVKQVDPINQNQYIITLPFLYIMLYKNIL